MRAVWQKHPPECLVAMTSSLDDSHLLPSQRVGPVQNQDLGGQIIIVSNYSGIAADWG